MQKVFLYVCSNVSYWTFNYSTYDKELPRLRENDPVDVITMSSGVISAWAQRLQIYDGKSTLQTLDVEL